MNLQLALIAYILPGMAIVFGIPMALRLIPPNHFYGYRTRKTFSSPAIWYRANRFSGWALAIAGIVALAHNLYFRHTHADFPPAFQQLFMAVPTGLLLLLAMVFSALYVRKL